jgi:hypothetical protein
MHRTLSMAVLAAVSLGSAFTIPAAAQTAAKTPAKAAAKGSDQGAIVLVFKDGRRQSFRLSELSRVEFAPAAAAASVDSTALPRGLFVGRWEAGDGAGRIFTITLEENGKASKSLGDSRGQWVWVDGEAHITWNDGWQDAIRKQNGKYFKYAYGAGKSFTDAPDNVTPAHNTTPRPS